MKQRIRGVPMNPAAQKRDETLRCQLLDLLKGGPCPVHVIAPHMRYLLPRLERAQRVVYDTTLEIWRLK